MNSVYRDLEALCAFYRQYISYSEDVFNRTLAMMRATASARSMLRDDVTGSILHDMDEALQEMQRLSQSAMESGREELQKAEATRRIYEELT